jgi:hypothetical protein
MSGCADDTASDVLIKITACVQERAPKKPFETANHGDPCCRLLRSVGVHMVTTVLAGIGKLIKSKAKVQRPVFQLNTAT